EIASVFDTPQKLGIVFNNEKVFESSIEDECVVSYEGKVNEDGIVELVLELPECNSPSNMGVSSDERMLAVAIRRMSFKKISVNR
nr:hypothetical protein [Lachnospiraceae bacterium]